MMTRMTSAEFRQRWPSIAQIPCVRDVLEEWASLERHHLEEVTSLRLALRDILDGAEQRSQSHADVIAKCREALEETP